MDELRLYQQIAESIRRDILSGRYQPGDRLPTVREMARLWNCTQGTVHHAYRELAARGLLTSRVGRGTRVVASPSSGSSAAPMRRAALVHRAETFLLESLTGGYQLDEVDAALRQAMDRWRTLEDQPPQPTPSVLRFAGSHDLALTWLASQFSDIAPGFTLQLNFTGSLGGMMALLAGTADFAGCHLFDEESGTYNLPYVRQLLPGQRFALVTLAQRRLGLILPPGNPLGIQSLADLTHPHVRFINRQPGSGTRVWLDLALQRHAIDPARISGYPADRKTHTAVAQAVAENAANAGIGLQAAALSYDLDFVFLTLEQYDLIIPAAAMETPPVADFVAWLNKPSTRTAIEKFGGYETARTGNVILSGD